MMKINLLFLLTTIFSINCYSQISFENGYYIDNNNQKINCLIKNLDWSYNPTKFKYKITEKSELNEKTIKSVKEFGINNALIKYVRSLVKIDRSSNKVDELDNERRPKFQEEELFLKVLVEGKATLYSYDEKSLSSPKYFYSIGTSNIEQLVFKSYITSEFEIGTNNRFRNQLWGNLKCSNIKKNRVEKMKYRKSDLVNFFVAYNSCDNQEYINFEEKQKKDLFNLTLRPRLNMSSLSNYRNTNIEKQQSFGFGLEAEFIFPFNKNKWSFIVEPTYQSFEKESETNVIINYRSIELHFGIRHYFFLNDNSKVFVNASPIYDFTLNDSQINSEKTKTAFNMALGLGYKHNNKYSIELRHQTPRLFDSTFAAEYKTLSIIFGYSLF